MMQQLKIVKQNTKMETFQNYLLTVFLTLFVVSSLFEQLGFTYIHNSDPRLQPQPIPKAVCTPFEAMQWWTSTDNLQDVRKKLCYNALKPAPKVNPSLPITHTK